MAFPRQPNCVFNLNWLNFQFVSQFSNEPRMKPINSPKKNSLGKVSIFLQMLLMQIADLDLFEKNKVLLFTIVIACGVISKCK
jgi:hypothetical protein